METSAKLKSARWKISENMQNTQEKFLLFYGYFFSVLAYFRNAELSDLFSGRI